METDKRLKSSTDVQGMHKDDRSVYGRLKNLVFRLKERAEILQEIIEIRIWQIRHEKEFREKYKNSKLVNPDVIRIYRDGPVSKTEQTEK